MCGCVSVFQSELASPFALLLGTCHRETFWLVWPSECFTVHNMCVTAQILSTLLNREYKAYVPLSLQADISTQSFEIGFYEAAPIVEATHCLSNLMHEEVAHAGIETNTAPFIQQIKLNPDDLKLHSVTF